MRGVAFRSIQTRIIVAVTILIVAIVTVMTWLWISAETEFYRSQKIQQAKSLALGFGSTLQGEVVEENWANMRIKLNIFLKGDEDLVYAMVHDLKKQQIAAAAPPELAGSFVTDVVPVTVSQNAIRLSNHQNSQVRISETYLLRNIEFPPKKLRGQEGEPIIEAAADIVTSTSPPTVVGVFRVGVTLRSLDAQITKTVKRTLAVGAIALFFGGTAAYYLAWRLSQPILKLRQSAAQIAAGDLTHRVPIRSRDELGALARSFNEMSDSLQISFGQLQQTLDSFERFVPEKFLQVIAPRGIENIAVGEYAKRNMTILFSDICGYTSLSESQTAEETFHFLNEYIACVGAAIEENGGFIDKYIGDAVMALFDEPHTDGALKAAIAMQAALKTFNQKRLHQGLQPVESGIGIHYGEVVMGTIGFVSRIDSTVIGDAVNVSSRIEGLTKQYNCEILVTDAVVEALSNPDIFYLELVKDAVKVKGKVTAIAIYQLHPVLAIL
ncbi:adenylate/guanylate cyclase domain-containing protein [Leptolyngbya sp. AN03gr2]|uniref:adenylate/guanylate cyclase domain-containing protein n=1 Tax=unclassified Leptolyngbya TaxID=2650499 RepID=UPI003D31E77C